MSEKTYEDGLTEGRFRALERQAALHTDRLDSHSSRIAWMERLVWATAGGAAIINGLPILQTAVKLLAGHN